MCCGNTALSLRLRFAPPSAKVWIRHWTVKFLDITFCFYKSHICGTTSSQTRGLETRLIVGMVSVSRSSASSNASLTINDTLICNLVIQHSFYHWPSTPQSIWVSTGIIFFKHFSLPFMMVEVNFNFPCYCCQIIIMHSAPTYKW